MLERGPVAGGRIGTVELTCGLRAEAHLEEFWASSPAYDLLQTFGLPLVEHPAASSFVADDELHLITDDGRCVFVGAGWPGDVRHSFARWNATARQLALDARAQAAVASMSTGSYVKVVMHVRADGTRLWDRFGGRLQTLLSDSGAGCVYLGDRGSAGQGVVLTALVHGRNARALHGLNPDGPRRGC